MEQTNEHEHRQSSQVGACATVDRGTVLGATAADEEGILLERWLSLRLLPCHGLGIVLDHLFVVFFLQHLVLRFNSPLLEPHDLLVTTFGTSSELLRAIALVAPPFIPWLHHLIDCACMYKQINNSHCIWYRLGFLPVICSDLCAFFFVCSTANSCAQ